MDLFILHYGPLCKIMINKKGFFLLVHKMRSTNMTEDPGYTQNCGPTVINSPPLRG